MPGRPLPVAPPQRLVRHLVLFFFLFLFFFFLISILLFFFFFVSSSDRNIQYRVEYSAADLSAARREKKTKKKPNKNLPAVRLFFLFFLSFCRFSLFDFLFCFDFDFDLIGFLFRALKRDDSGVT